jgi:DNA-binding transcriptional regulator YhcF (GntR family)
VVTEVETGSPIPPFEQIREQVTTMVMSGALPSGAHLPSIRQLAADLGLAPNTVARAYRELETDGMVTSRVRHGTTVTADPVTVPRAEARRRLGEAAHAYAVLARRLNVAADDAVGLIRVALDEQF